MRCAPMITVYKLEKLHRSQRLRKIASVFAAAQRRFASGPEIAAGELVCFSDMARLLLRDPLFDKHAMEVFAEAAKVFGLAAAPGNNGENADDVKRFLNSARHILLAETGQSQADWDFLDGDGRLDPGKRL
ncbi:MAG: TrmH family RNA methyltransferase, partial [Treponema sp.]|nr:TrmH family RNA methyltransferase [Treponema sp.]